MIWKARLWNMSSIRWGFPVDLETIWFLHDNSFKCICMLLILHHKDNAWIFFFNFLLRRIWQSEKKTTHNDLIFKLNSIELNGVVPIEILWSIMAGVCHMYICMYAVLLCDFYWSSIYLHTHTNTHTWLWLLFCCWIILW